jgi:hypothetical protein
MARIPREFIKVDAGLYRYGSFSIRKDGVTKQDGSIQAVYTASDELGCVIGWRNTTKEILELIVSVVKQKTNR